MLNINLALLTTADGKLKNLRHEILLQLTVLTVRLVDQKTGPE